MEPSYKMVEVDGVKVLIRYTSELDTESDGTRITVDLLYPGQEYDKLKYDAMV